jgi:hypothetical protein
MRRPDHHVCQKKAYRAITDDATEANDFLRVHRANAQESIGQRDLYGSVIVTPEADGCNHRLVLVGRRFACHDCYSHWSAVNDHSDAERAVNPRAACGASALNGWFGVI